VKNNEALKLSLSYFSSLGNKIYLSMNKLFQEVKKTYNKYLTNNFNRLGFHYLLIAAIFVQFSLTGYSQTLTEINDIVNNPGRFNNEFVTIQGIVTQYTPGSAQTTAYYLLKGDYGGLIKVNTNAQQPETNNKYEVSGTIVIDQLNREAYVIEQQRREIIIFPPPPPPSRDYTTLILIIGAVVLLLVITGFVIVQKRKPVPAPYPSGGFSTMPGGSKFAPPPVDPVTRRITNNDNDFQTIKISMDAAPKTMKLLPGFLEITAGADKGKKFSISGYPTPNGSIISIGRETVTGDRKYAHIQLKEQTVSRQQAEIIATGSNLEVKNLSSTNLTQLNGIEIQPGQKLNLEPDSIIKVGEVEFAYRK
jgi:hypothetical protein